MALLRKWDIQSCWNPWPLTLGFHFDHTDPSLTIHLPVAIISFGRLKQPGFKRPDNYFTILDERDDLRAQLAAAEKRATEAEERLDRQIAKSAMYREALDDIKLWLQNEGAWDVEEDEIHRAIEVALLSPNARAQAAAEFLIKLRKTWEDDSEAALVIEVGDFFCQARRPRQGAHDMSEQDWMTPEERELYERYCNEALKVLPTTTSNEEMLTAIICKADARIRALSRNQAQAKKRRKVQR